MLPKMPVLLQQV